MVRSYECVGGPLDGERIKVEDATPGRVIRFAGIRKNSAEPTRTFADAVYSLVWSKQFNRKQLEWCGDE